VAAVPLEQHHRRGDRSRKRDRGLRIHPVVLRRNEHEHFRVDALCGLLECLAVLAGAAVRRRVRNASPIESTRIAKYFVVSTTFAEANVLEQVLRMAAEIRRPESRLRFFGVQFADGAMAGPEITDQGPASELPIAEVGKLPAGVSSGAEAFARKRSVLP
jgi:hypothetical protein